MLNFEHLSKLFPAPFRFVNLFCKSVVLSHASRRCRICPLQAENFTFTCSYAETFPFCSRPLDQWRHGVGHAHCMLWSNPRACVAMSLQKQCIEFVINAKPACRYAPKNKNSIKYRIWRLVVSTAFEYLIMVLIALNTLLLMMKVNMCYLLTYLRITLRCDGGLVFIGNIVGLINHQSYSTSSWVSTEMRLV